jgi:7-cyano-7-deazaguanine synthase
MNSIVLLSGGLDSTVCFHLTAQADEARLALTFDYGQRAAQREIAAARAMCRRAGVEHRVIELPWLREITETALVNISARLPEPTVELLDEAQAAVQTAADVWVPNRNGVFINVAAAFAETRECEDIVCGFNIEEAATFPDNSAEFVGRINAALAVSTLSEVRVVSPTQDMTKPDIVRLGRRIAAPLDLIWSCYEGGDQHCYRCESCLRLKRALEEAGEWGWFQQVHRPAAP